MKTNILCISDASTYHTKAYLLEGSGGRLESRGKDSTMKVLGFTFSSVPRVRAYIMTIRKKFRQRFWTLYNLKMNGFSKKELVRVYETCVRPVADYLDVVYHPMLTDDLDKELDRLKNHALKIIFGPRNGGRTLRDLAGVTTLRERRVIHCDKFAAKCAESSRYGDWFPLKTARRSGRSKTCEMYVKKVARCDRLHD